MARFTLLHAITTLVTASTLITAKYTIKDDYSSTNFFNGFSFFSGPDPTNGFVQYQSLENATVNNYVGYYNKSVYMGVDYETKTPNGRPSIRVIGNNTYNQGLLIADIRHMPQGCGTWPSMWLYQDPWPTMGEIDILEGVNDATQNAITLHTSAGCAVDNSTSGAKIGSSDAQMSFTGFMNTTNCDVNAADQNKNAGCSIQAPTSHPAPTYGAPFNAAGGGVYAMEWTSTDISVWFFGRNSTNMPTDLTTSPDPGTFGTPIAKFAGNGCNFTQRFQNLKIVFDTTFCGDWAGKVWEDSCAASTKTSTCQAYVEDNPEAFQEAYWLIDGLRWFENDGANNDPHHKREHIARHRYHQRRSYHF